jgi:U3 small nucleolar RNA-associated protein 23
VPENIDQAKQYERRRCGHHTLDTPLSTLECLQSVVDAKGSGSNKHRYVVASQSREVRELMRTIPGVPMVYINRSVMIMEPMASATEQNRARGEKAKLRAGIKGKRTPTTGVKRKRDDEEPAATSAGAENGEGAAAKKEKKEKKKKKGPKGPNPLSVKKPKKKEVVRIEADDASGAQQSEAEAIHIAQSKGSVPTIGGEPDVDASSQGVPKKKRKRKHTSKTAGADDEVKVSSNDVVHDVLSMPN